MIEIKNLEVSIDDKKILDGFNLAIKPDEVHAIMGPNGSGKSTLAKVIAGHPGYQVTGGQLLLEGVDINELAPEERSHAGIFLGLQYPIEIPGVNNSDFLRMIYNAKRKHRGEEEVDPIDFAELVEEKLPAVGLRPSFLERSVNHGFSGGEKKRNEILQMLLLDPKFSILDEIDSGLDIDALRTLGSAVQDLQEQSNGTKSLLLITHYQRLLDFIRPTHVHIMIQGKIVESGDFQLVQNLEKTGYDPYLS
ncbi:Fe-S cluster assembly ATPase SufC [Candidatus Haliotispira prima]|uniref:Fe-S cluster assembly ATPase SufC n=1 Tax=Candidatus Haliotispira prima TaxID=3034016 RepID=A0ABY8MGW5_9SPIO|nr:Fe-S cluster assembly ATPase SufC [Candidatus Haliotispira prima]